MPKGERDAKRVAKGKNAQVRGATFERWVAQQFAPIVKGKPQRRVIGEEAQDRMVGIDINGTEPYAVQCQKGSVVNILKKYDKAAGVARQYKRRFKYPVAVTQRLRGPVLVTIALEHFVAIAKKQRSDEKPGEVVLPQVELEPPPVVQFESPDF